MKDETLTSCPACGEEDRFHVVEGEYLCLECEFYTDDGSIYGMPEETTKAVDDGLLWETTPNESEQLMADELRQIKELEEEVADSTEDIETEETQEVKPKKKRYYHNLNVKFKKDFIERLNEYCGTKDLTKRQFVKDALENAMLEKEDTLRLQLKKAEAQVEGLQISLDGAQDEINKLKEENKKGFFKRLVS